MHAERATILLESVRALRRAEGKEYLRRKKARFFLYREAPAMHSRTTRR